MCGSRGPSLVMPSGQSPPLRHVSHESQAQLAGQGCPPRAMPREGRGATQGSVGAGTPAWMGSDLGEGGRCAWGTSRSAPRPRPRPGWTQVAWGNIREGRASSGLRHLISAAPRPPSPTAIRCSRSQGPAQDAGQGPSAASGLSLGSPGRLSGSGWCCLASRRWWARTALRRRVRSPPRSPQVQGPRPPLPPAARLQDTQKGALGAEVGARPLGYSSTKQRALTDRAPPPAVLGTGVIDRSPQPSPDL